VPRELEAGVRKKRPLSALRRELDKVFSIYIRRRGATVDGWNRCVTCGRLQRWQEGHAGHFIKRQHLATRYDPRNVHFQDAYCNTYRGGALIEYTLFMQQTYGQAVVDELMRLKRVTVKLHRADYEEMLRKYSDKTACQYI